MHICLSAVKLWHQTCTHKLCFSLSLSVSYSLTQRRTQRQNQPSSSVHPCVVLSAKMQDIDRISSIHALTTRGRVQLPWACECEWECERSRKSGGVCTQTVLKPSVLCFKWTHTLNTQTGKSFLCVWLMCGHDIQSLHVQVYTLA